MRWLIDGNNVMGSRPDGWWNDRAGAMARLSQEIAEWCWTHDESVVLVFDGPEQDQVTELAGGNLAIHFAKSSARDAADDVLAELATSGDTVVTADRGLIARLATGVDVLGPKALLSRVARRSGPEA